MLSLEGIKFSLIKHAITTNLFFIKPFAFESAAMWSCKCVLWLFLFYAHSPTSKTDIHAPLSCP